MKHPLETLKNVIGCPAVSTADRGISEVVAVALLIGIVFIGIAAVLLIGGGVLAETQGAADIGQATHALVQFDSKATAVALGESPVQQVELGFGRSRGTLTADSNSGWIRVNYVRHPTMENVEVVNTTLGAVVFTRGDTTVGYQGGGVWRSDGDDSVMVSRPEFHFRNNTLTMPIITTRGESVHSNVQLTRSAPSDPRFPNESAALTNKIQNARLEITIQSDYYLAWGRYFEEDVSAIVWYDHAEETATIQFLSLPLSFAIENGVIATSGPGEINMRATGAYIDSYDSRIGPYSGSQSRNGTVEAAGNVDMGGDAEIAGDVHSGHDIILGSSSNVIDGDANYTNEIDKHSGATVTGTINQIDGVTSVPPIDGFVDLRVNELRQQNDNDNTSIISGNELDIPGASGELPPGEYYLDHLELLAQSLVLNTTEGNITIGIRDWVQLDRLQGTGGQIDVVGNGSVKVFIKGEREVTATTPGLGEQELDLHIGRNSSVQIPGQRSTQVVFFGKSDMNATIAGSSGDEVYFTGVIYAPAGHFGTGWVHSRHGDLYGAVITGSLILDNQGQVHFDHALAELELPLAPAVPRLEYYYATVYEIDVRHP